MEYCSTYYWKNSTYKSTCTLQTHVVEVVVNSLSLDCSTQASTFFTIFQSLLKLMSLESVIPSNHLILCRPLLIWPSIFPSIRVFSNEMVLHIRWPKYWIFNFSISPSNEYSGLISFRIYWFDLAVQGTPQESSPAPQLEGINSLVLSLFYCPALTSIHEYWKNNSFDYMDLCWQNDVHAF